MNRHVSLSLLFAGLTLLLFLLQSCSPTRYLASDESMLSDVKVVSATKQVKTADYIKYVRQQPNARWFNLVKVPLGIYCLSPADTTKRRGRFFRRLGEAPVVYDTASTAASRAALLAALQSRGYLHATVDTLTQKRRRRVRLTYKLRPGVRYVVDSLAYRFDDPRLERAVTALRTKSLLHVGMPLDVSVLNEERNRVITALQNQGYYRINRDFVGYDADTVAGSDRVALTFVFSRPPGIDSLRAYQPYRFRTIKIWDSPSLGADKLAFRKHLYKNHLLIRPDSLFREEDVQDSYSAMNGLSAVRYTTIKFNEPPGDSALLDADVTIVRNKPNAVSLELEGTNTSGDLGAALALSFTNRNLFKGAERLLLKGRMAYEAIRGLEGYGNENYLEFSGEASLRFPTFRLPFVRQSARQRLKATSDLSFMYNSQNRPEFHRRVVTGNWAYRWSYHAHPGFQHRFDMISLNYVFMPWISNTFRRDYLNNADPRYSILRASYADLFIMNTGYSFVYNSQQDKERGSVTFSPLTGQLTKGWQVKFGIEAAGNLLHGISKIVRASKNEAGQYRLFNIAYSQYVKVDVDFVRSLRIDSRNTFAFHAAFGLAIPYGNSAVIPYEKRYFAGGANSVRGWNVRSLGPGNYVEKDGKVDFINQTGNMKLDLSFEWRTALFWKFNGAFFVDAGNVWNTRRYENLSGSRFHLRSFYKQLAVAYGLGLRLNLDYFILRLDGGMKAVDPAYPSGRGHYPLIHPKFSRDFVLHFAVGLPF